MQEPANRCAKVRVPPAPKEIEKEKDFGKGFIDDRKGEEWGGCVTDTSLWTSPKLEMNTISTSHRTATHYIAHPHPQGELHTSAFDISLSPSNHCSSSSFSPNSANKQRTKNTQSVLLISLSLHPNAETTDANRCSGLCDTAETIGSFLLFVLRLLSV